MHVLARCVRIVVVISAFTEFSIEMGARRAAMDIAISRLGVNWNAFAEFLNKDFVIMAFFITSGIVIFAAAN